MGQAKNRGTYEERKAAAIVRAEQERIEKQRRDEEARAKAQAEWDALPEAVRRAKILQHQKLAMMFSMASIMAEKGADARRACR